MSVDGTSVIEEVPLAVKLKDSMMVGIAVAGYLVQDSPVLPGTIDAVADSVCCLLWETD